MGDPYCRVLLEKDRQESSHGGCGLFPSWWRSFGLSYPFVIKQGVKATGQGVYGWVCARMKLTRAGTGQGRFCMQKNIAAASPGVIPRERTILGCF